MGRLALKNLTEERARLAISAGGVAFAVMLVLLLWAIVQGVVGQAGALVKNTPADVWVVQRGFTDLSHGFSVLPDRLRGELATIDGVQRVSPISGAASELEINGVKTTLLVVGYDTTSGIGGPWSWASAPARPRTGEIVVDETFAETNGVQVGDRLELPDKPRRVVALSADTNQFTNQLAFAPVDDVRSLTRLDDAVNFYAISTREPRAVKRRIERLHPSVSAFVKPEFIANNEREIRDGFEPILWVMVAAAFFVGMAVIGLTIFTATVEKSREYGVLTAIGAEPRQLYGVILRQAAVASLLGFAVGVALVFPLRALIAELVPKVEVDLSPGLFATVGLASLAMGLLASWLPMRRIARLDPAAVFRA
jgi:putative ABC transport system permease protein